MLAVLAVATTSACRVDVSIGIDADDRGGGEVRARARLDGSAVAQLGGPEPSERIRLDDLREAGWEITGPTEQDDGGLEIVATHDFASAEEAEALVADLAGDPGPLRSFEVTQHRSFLKTHTDFRGTVDLQAGLGAFTDPDLQAALQGTPQAPLGVTTAALEQRLGAALDRLFGLQVAVKLPGTVESNAPTETGNGAVWAPSLGEQVVLEASGERWNVANLVGAATAALSGAALLGVVGGRWRRTRSNVTLGNDGATGEDRGGAPSPEG